MPNTSKSSFITYLLAITFTVGAVLFLVLTPAPKGKVYDCTLSEISPDYPLEVKEECRKLRAKNFQEDLKKPK